MPSRLTYPGVYIGEDASGVRTISGVATSITAFVGSALRGPLDASPDSPVRVRSFAEFERTFGGLARAHPMSYAVDQFFRNGGGDALIVRVAGKDGAAISDAQVSAPALRRRKRGMWALDRADLFNLLCIPPFSFAATGDIGARTRSAAAMYARERRAMFIVDALMIWHQPSDLGGTTGLESARWGLARTENAALYFPRIRCPDPLQQGALADFAACGAVAGVLARTDTQRGVWKAPAGTEATLSGVAELTVSLTDAQNGLLNPLGVNCLRAFPNIGRVVWGARTLQGADALASEWKYVSVRRLALYIEESLYRGLQWVVFEPDGEPLWAQIRLSVGAFMNTLFRQGAFQGRTPQEAYFVKCDRATTTQSDIDLGVVDIVVGFAPLKPAEFVVIRLRQIAGQAAP